MACDQRLAALRAAAATIVRFFSQQLRVSPALAAGVGRRSAAACLAIVLAAASVGRSNRPP